MEDVKELSGEIIYVTTPERAINYKWEKNPINCLLIYK